MQYECAEPAGTGCNVWVEASALLPDLSISDAWLILTPFAVVMAGVFGWRVLKSLL
jgi:hypothetical protein